ncbi:MAG: carboxypeptidase-like regulatory domain-containing protein [Lewinella sp.]
MLKVLFALALPALLCGQTSRPDTLYQLSGRLSDASTNESISFATIYCPSCSYGGTVTNEQGSYILSSPGPVAEIRVDHIMYGTLKTSVRQGAGELRMQREVHDLPEVVVDGTEALQLVERAYARLASHQNATYRGEGFYRQATRLDGKYTELLEYFVTVKYANQRIGDWKVKTGRYAVTPSPDRIQFINHSYFTRGWRVHHDAYNPDNFTTPVNPAAYHLYDFRIAGRIQKEAGEVILVDALPSADKAGSLIAARLYILKGSAELLQAEYTLEQFEMDQPVRGTFRPGRLTAAIRFRTAADGASLIQSMTTETAVQYHDSAGQAHALEVNSLFINFPPQPVNGKAGASADSAFDDLRAASGKKYRPKWWDRHPVVAATPVEQEVIEDFNRANYFGNYFDLRD